MQVSPPPTLGKLCSFTLEKKGSWHSQTLAVLTVPITNNRCPAGPAPKGKLKPQSWKIRILGATGLQVPWEFWAELNSMLLLAVLCYVIRQGPL